MTEPEAGTNSFAARTYARKSPDGTYRITGQKVFISGADESDHILLLARTAPAGGEPLSRRSGFGLFIVDMSLPGIDLRRLDIEWHAPENQYEVFFDDVEVPADALIGTDGLGVRSHPVVSQPGASDRGCLGARARRVRAGQGS